MIDWLEVRQFAIAEHIEIEFEASFTAVTGETGSGKSLIVDAIDILLGHRSDASYIRHGHDTAELQAGFTLSDDHPAQKWLLMHGVYDSNDCIVRRVLRRNRASRAFINGHAVTASQLRELGSFLIDIHGQNEHLSLLGRKLQLHLLDMAAGNKEQVETISDTYKIIYETRLKISALENHKLSNLDRLAVLQFQLEELQELSPKDGEWEQIEQSQRRASHQVDLVTGTSGIYDELYGCDSGGINAALLRHINLLAKFSEYAPELTGAGEMLSEAQLNIEEAAAQLGAISNDTSFDTAQIEAIESRLTKYHTLARKHRIQPAELANHKAALELEYESIADPEIEMTQFQTQLNQAISKYRVLSESVSRNRKITAARLEKEITEIMQQLGMQGGRFQIALTPVGGDEITVHGFESVDFLVTANPGMPLRPLGKATSGGELSRISLAIQVVLADKSTTPTMIFDEVDAGIGGGVANIVGQKLKELGEKGQVICVTHLSQVAARGNHQLSVVKSTGEIVDTSVVKLTPEQRILEIARMTGGENITAQTLAHAEEILCSA